MTDKIKPCPFCGNTDIRRVLTHSYCRISCNKCNAFISSGLFCGKYDTLREAEDDFGRDANNKWNRRADNDR